MLDIVFNNSISDKKYTPKFFERILNTATQELKINGKKIGISINLVDEAKIKKLNRKYRNKNKPTDVLSFPISKGLEIRNSKLEIEKDVGDIFICLSIAKNEAKGENITIEQKLAQLTVHGFLHLLGYDHEKSPGSAEKMFRIESQILRKIKF